VIHKPSELLLTLRFSHLFRIFFYGLGLFILYFIFQESNQENSNVGPYIFIGICALLGSYHESWTFDKSQDIIEQRLGLLFLFKKKKFPLSNLKGLSIVRFAKGSQLKSAPESAPRKKYKYPPKEYHKLSLILNNDEYQAVEIVQGREMESFKRKAEILAQFCGCPLWVEK
jgi:hypothetical protein